MEESSTSTPQSETKTVQSDFVISQKQIDALASRLLPEIKKFYTDERTQKEFNEWKEKQNIA